MNVSDELLLYLGRIPSPRNAAEFRSHFDDDDEHQAALQRVEALVQEGFNVDIDLNWELTKIGEETRRVMRERHPELTDEAIRKLANARTYSLR